MMEDLEQRAERLLARVPAWMWDGESVPVPVEDIADSVFGLHIRDVEDLRTAPGAPELESDRALSGLLLPSLGEIWVNAQEGREWPPRRRFTIGHELGHWCLHREGEGAVYCRAVTVEVPEGDGPRAARPPEEEEANFFAAVLLMPTRLVRRHYERAGGDFWRLCEMFEVSGAAMGRRLHAVI